MVTYKGKYIDIKPEGDLYVWFVGSNFGMATSEAHALRDAQDFIDELLAIAG